MRQRAREHVDLRPLTVDLLAVIGETMQPTQVSLQLRASGETDDGAVEGG